MRLPCKVIEDLLPLYQDLVCSGESKELVEAHLRECKSCKAMLAKMQEEMQPARNQAEGKPLQSLQKAWKKGKKKSFLKGAVLAATLCALLVGGYIGLTQWKCIPVSEDLIKVTEVSQLADGRIIYHLQIDDNKNLRFVRFDVNDQGEYSMTPMRSVIEKERTMDNGLYNQYYIVDIAQQNTYQQERGQEGEMQSCYVGSEKDGILIWEKGMELPKAKESLEELVQGGDVVLTEVCESVLQTALPK